MILTRIEWGALPLRSGSTFISSDRSKIQFLTLHRDRIPMPPSPLHSACPSVLRSAQLRDQGEGRVDLRWNVVACPHGQLYDVRGTWLLAETFSPEIDAMSLAVAFTGEMTDDGMVAVRGYWAYLRALFPGLNIALHSDWQQIDDEGHKTDCPGNNAMLVVEGWRREGF